MNIKSLAAIATPLLGACASFAPAPQLQPPLPQGWSNGSEFRPAPDAATTATQGDWWRPFHDSTLNRLLQAALASNLTIAAAREHLRAALTVVPVADSAFRPSLAASTGSDTTADARRSYLQASLGALWELPLLNRPGNERLAATSNAAAAAADLANAQMTAVAAVARGYFGTLAAAHSIELLQTLAKLKAQRLAQLRTQARIGMATEAGVPGTESELLAVRERIAELDFTQAKRSQQMAAILGETSFDSTQVQAHDAYPSYALQLDTTPADLLRARPDVRHAEAEVLAAAAELGIARADVYPHLSLAGAITVAAPMSGAAGLPAGGVVSLGPVLEIPLFDWGRRRATADARAAQLQAALFDYRQTVLDAVAEVETALANMHRATELLDLQQQTVALSDEAARREGISRRIGLSTDQATCAACSAIEAKLSLTAAQYARAIAVVDLHEALGGPVAATPVS